MKKVLVIGAGGIGKRHINGFIRSGRAKVWIVEPDKEKRDAAIRDYGIEGAYESLEKAGLSSFDLAVIATPAHLHIPMALQCIEAKVHFLMEKPLSVTMEGVDDLIEKTERSGLYARVGYVRRSAISSVEFVNQIRSGRVGELKMGYMNASQDFPKYRPDYINNYYAREATGGGCILDFGSHLIDMAVWIFGEPSEVTSMSDRLSFEGVECEDCGLVSIRFKSKCLVQINLNHFQKPNKNIVEVIGTKGNLELDFVTMRFAEDDSGKWQESRHIDGGSLQDIHNMRFEYQARNMLDVIEGKASNLATLEDARTVLKIVLAARQSEKEKRTIRIS